MKTPIKLYLGSDIQENARGSWSFICFDNSISPAGMTKQYGESRHTTRNRMLLTSLIQALYTLPNSCEIVIFTDSIYLKRCVDTGWRWLANPNTDLPNKDLLIQMNELLQKHHTYKSIVVDSSASNRYIDIANTFAEGG